MFTKNVALFFTWELTLFTSHEIIATSIGLTNGINALFEEICEGGWSSSWRETVVSNSQSIRFFHDEIERKNLVLLPTIRKQRSPVPTTNEKYRSKKSVEATQACHAFIAAINYDPAVTKSLAPSAHWQVRRLCEPNTTDTSSFVQMICSRGGSSPAGKNSS
ncbi:MAG: hypothetical protein GY822_16865 [Deltaproteobacteria bacterium]|nr:hypothetical protein [Deltaproteobacteria bacterium]